MENTPGSVGVFGVGMKRAIFKMGASFSVRSDTEDAHFLIEQDIDEWKKTSEWLFRFERV